MPIYEYKSKACGTMTEVLERGGAHREVPKCGSEEVEKMLSSFAAVTTEGAGASAISC